MKNVFKNTKPRGYQAMKQLPEDQYGRFRDRRNNQQATRKVAEESKYNLPLIFGLIAGTVTFLGVAVVIWVIKVGCSVISQLPITQSSEPLTFTVPWWGWLLVAVLSVLIGAIFADTTRRKQKSDHMLEEDGIINSYADDMHIQYQEEMTEMFGVFPDVGAHSSTKVSTLISHLMLDNKKVPKVRVPKRYDEDTVDEDGDPIYKGEEVLDNNGNVIYEEVPIIDRDYGEFIYDKAGFDKKNPERQFIDPHDVVMKPNMAKSDDQNQKYNKLTDMMSKDWTLPDYEIARPAGVYLVDTAAVNTMVLAITRAGKGQTIINNTIDMWTREDRKWNIVLNDPKGELLRTFLVPAIKRGYDVVQFNLINAMKTDVFNPLGYAVEAAREGKIDKVSEYLTNLSDIFFPKDGGEDKVWPESAAAAFERSCLGLIDYYLEEEHEIRRRAELQGKNPQLLDAEINNMWGKVSLYNAFKFFLSLVSKKETDPDKVWVREADKPPMVWDEENQIEVVDPSTPKADKALLDLFFDATDELPNSSVRNQIESSNNTLKTMMQSEKMLSSVYGIATSGMRFFADPTIVALTSGTASQNFDIESLSFPRRIAVRFASEWMVKYKYAGKLTRWSAYSDETFTEKLDDKLFGHEHVVEKTGWAYYAFDGMFDSLDSRKRKVGYVKMEILDPKNNFILKTFYFKATLKYQTSLDGTSYVKRPVTGEKVIKNGVLTELQRVQHDDGSVTFEEDYTRIEKVVKDFSHYVKGSKAKDIKIKVPAFSMLKLNYTERPKMIAFITPPHLMAYARLILILIKQATDSAMSTSYITKANQKPLYGTRYMLDELGNLQSDGHGIPHLETMLSIGLSANQQFTLILQTLQQLIAVYGDDVDKIVQGNTNNIIFIKSNDVSTVDNLVSLAGKTHTERNNSMTLTKDTEARVKKSDGKVSITKSVVEEDVLPRNVFLQLKRQESIVMRAGSNPIYNYGHMLLPMEWQLRAYKPQLNVPGVDYSLQTTPTMSSSLEFDADKNIPDFYAMVEKRVAQARLVAEIKERYRDAYGYSQIDIDRLNEDDYAQDIMNAINDTLWAEYEEEHQRLELDDDDLLPSGEQMFAQKARLREQTLIDNDEYKKAELDAMSKEVPDYDKMLYAGGTISRQMLITRHGEHGIMGSNVSTLIGQAVVAVKGQFMNDVDYRWDDKRQVLTDDKGTVLVSYNNVGMDEINEWSQEDSRVFAEDILDNNERDAVGYVVHEAFLLKLANLESWSSIAGGAFDNKMRQLMEKEDSVDEKDA